MKSKHSKAPAERVVKDIRRATRKQYSAEENIRIVLDCTQDTVTIELPLLLPLRGGKKLITRSGLASPRPDEVLIAALRKAHAMLSNERGFPVIGAAPVSPYDRKILRLAFLAPDIQLAIIKGYQPPHLNLEKIQQITVPSGWKKQREQLGFQSLETGISGE